MSHQKPTVLIAEDEDNLREMYVMALTNAGYEVLPAINGVEVMELLEKKYLDVDILLLDIVMPVMDGFETLKKVKDDDRFSKIPVLVSTNLDNGEDRQQALGLGALDYYIKSNHTPSELVKEIRDVLAAQGGHIPVAKPIIV